MRDTFPSPASELPPRRQSTRRYFTPTRACPSAFRAAGPCRCCVLAIRMSRSCKRPATGIALPSSHCVGCDRSASLLETAVSFQLVHSTLRGKAHLSTLHCAGPGRSPGAALLCAEEQSFQIFTWPLPPRFVGDFTWKARGSHASSCLLAREKDGDTERQEAQCRSASLRPLRQVSAPASCQLWSVPKATCSHRRGRPRTCDQA